MSTEHHEITEATIRELVDRFYARVRRHPQLGPVFAASIAADEWPTHLGKMYAFWSSVMLTSGRYKGNPVAVHRAVPGIEPGLFATWLDLFEATAVELFTPESAERFAQGARRIAESLKLSLFFRADQPWPDDLRHRAAARATNGSQCD